MYKCELSIIQNQPLTIVQLHYLAKGKLVTHDSPAVIDNLPSVEKSLYYN